MSAARDMSDWFARAARASEEVMVGRDKAREMALSAIRDIERQLCGAIVGDTLRGMSNLGSSGGRPCLGARVRNRGQHGADVYERKVDESIAPGDRSLVVTKDGELQVWSAASEGGDLACRPVTDAELVAQDLDAIARTVRWVLERHVARSERAAASYVRVTRLAGAIRSAVG